MKVCVLIPSYNEADTIGRVIRSVMRLGLGVIVVDDGSTDGTDKAARETGVVILRHMKNLGKGASIKEGVDFILRSTDYDAVLIMDADGQHEPGDAMKFIDRLRNHGEDIIVGNRMGSTVGMPFVRLLTNKFMSRLLSSICKQSIPDTQCGFKLIKREVLEKITLDSDNFDFDSEVLLKAARNNFKIASVPIKTIYRGEQSYINPIKDTMRFIRLLSGLRARNL